MSVYTVSSDKEDFSEGFGSDIEASSPEEAAERYLQDDCDTTRHDGDEYEVFVFLPDGVVKRFSAMCSVKITFDVEEVNVDE